MQTFDIDSEGYNEYDCRPVELVTRSQGLTHIAGLHTSPIEFYINIYQNESVDGLILICVSLITTCLKGHQAIL